MALCASSRRAAPLHAQTAADRPRWGITTSVGFGAGSSALTCPNCQSSPGGGAAGFGRVGGAYRSDLIVALGVNWWNGHVRSPRQDGSLTLWTTDLVLQWYPTSARRWFVSPGLGYSHIGTDIRGSIFGPADASGIGYELGTGYDIRITPHVALTPYAIVFGTPGDRKLSPDQRLRGRVAQLGLGLSWQ